MTLFASIFSYFGTIYGRDFSVPGIPPETIPFPGFNVLRHRLHSTKIFRGKGLE